MAKEEPCIYSYTMVKGKKKKVNHTCTEVCTMTDDECMKVMRYQKVHVPSFRMLREGSKDLRRKLKEEDYKTTPARDFVIKIVRPPIA